MVCPPAAPDTADSLGMAVAVLARVQCMLGLLFMVDLQLTRAGDILRTVIPIVIFYSARYPYRWGSPWANGSYGYGYGSYGYPGWGWSVGFDDSSSYPSQQYPAAAYAYPDYSGAYAQNSQIQQDEIDRLSREVDRLQEDRASRQPEAPPKAQVHADTVLVFRDKHTEEIQNYALVGNTLWVFTELRARKIPVSNLDVTATTRANEDRGIEFNLPK